MGFVGLVLLIGLLNLGLGYAMAVHLGFGSAAMPDLHVAALGNWRGLAHGLARRRTASASSSQLGASTATADGLFQEVLCTDEDLAVDETKLAEMLDDDPDDSGEVDPYYEPYDDDVAELLNPDQPEAWELNEKFVETSILKLNIAMIKSGQRAMELDTRLRAIRGRSDQATIRQCVADLLEDCQTYLVEQSEAAEKFRDRIGELGELKSLGEEIEMANLEQAAQIETTMSNLQHMNFEGDLEAANHRVLGELNSLRIARHRLRDNQEMAFMTIARYEDRIEKIERQLHNDSLTKLRNRIGLEATLWQWWRQNRHQSRQMSAALFDLDRFGKLNEEYGFALCDRLLVRVAELIQQQVNTADLVGRFAGQRFLAVLLDVGPRTAIKTAEFVRQTIEKASFLEGDTRIPLTISSGIVEVSPADTHESFLQRLEATLKSAKEAGGNQAAFHDGRKIEPVQSPNLGAKPQEIRLS
jgi:diguanylate cyclase (GGDEF)-like protein